MRIDRFQIQAALKAENAKGNSYKQLAAQIGTSDATVSKIINGQHDDISDAMWRKVLLFLGLDEWRIVNTANFATIQNLCADAQARHRMRVVVGPTGSGKTTALYKYCFRPDVRNAFYVLMKASMTQKDILREIMRSLGLNQEATIYRMLDLIADKLNSLDHPVLILDDAGKLKDLKLLLIQQIRDMTEDNCGMVLAGVDYMYDNLTAGVRRNKVGYPELLSRLGRFQGLGTPTLAEVTAICAANGVDDGEVAQHIARNFKEFRAVKDAIMDLMHYADAHKAPINLKTAKELWM